MGKRRLPKDWWMTIDNIDIQVIGGADKYGLVTINGWVRDDPSDVIQVQLNSEDFDNEVSKIIMKLVSMNKARIYRV